MLTFWEGRTTQSRLREMAARSTFRSVVEQKGELVAPRLVVFVGFARLPDDREVPATA
jgi:hypothetical protein